MIKRIRMQKKEQQPEEEKSSSQNSSVEQKDRSKDNNFGLSQRHLEILKKVRASHSKPSDKWV
jgi:hypothetical protein